MDDNDFEELDLDDMLSVCDRCGSQITFGDMPENSSGEKVCDVCLGDADDDYFRDAYEDEDDE